jgi:hypothetical protein
MSENTPTQPQPQVYLIHDDQDRAAAELLVRHFVAEGMPAWCRGQRPPKGQGADNIIRKAKVAVLISTDHAMNSQLVHVDLTRAARDNIPLVRLVRDSKAEAFAADYLNIAGTVMALDDIDAQVMTSLFEISRPALTKGFFSFSRSRSSAGKTTDADTSETKDSAASARGRTGKSPVRSDASAVGLRMTLQRLAPLFLIGMAFLGGVTWWWQGRARETEVVEMKRRATERSPLTAPMQDLSAGRLVEATVAASNGKSLPPGVFRAGYDAEASATDVQIADAASVLEVTKISRSAFKVVDGKRTCDVQVTVTNPSDISLPVVALTVGLRDKANLNLAERILKVERRWVSPGGTRVIEGQLSDLPKWAQTISIKVSASKV